MTLPEAKRGWVLGLDHEVKRAPACLAYDPDDLGDDRGAESFSLMSWRHEQQTQAPVVLGWVVSKQLDQSDHPASKGAEHELLLGLCSSWDVIEDLRRIADVIRVNQREEVCAVVEQLLDLRRTISPEPVQLDDLLNCAHATFII